MVKNLRINSLFILFAVFLLSVSGCRTLRAPDTPHSAWHDAPKNTKLESSTQFAVRERVLESSDPLDLGEFVDMGLQNNPSTRQAWQAARAAEAEVQQAKSALYPDINVTLTSDRKKTIEKAENILVKDAEHKVVTIDDHSTYGPASSLTMLLLDFGGRSAGIEKASQELLSKNYSFNQSILDLFLSVQIAYYGLYSAKENVKATKANVEDAYKSLETAQKQFDVGLTAKLDVLQAKSSYENSLYLFEEAKGDFETAKGSLITICGFPANTPFEIKPPSEEIPQNIPRDKVETLINIALDARPDIMKARSDLRAKEEAVKVANSNLWPTFNAGASAEANWYHYYPDTNATVSVRDVRDQEYRGYLNVDWDIFDGFSNISKKRAAEYELAGEYDKLIEDELAATQDVWMTYYKYKTSARKYIYSKSYLESSREAFDLALKSYDQGLKDILYLLTAQSSLANARSRLVQSRKDLFVDVAELAHATGTFYMEDK